MDFTGLNDMQRLAVSNHKGRGAGFGRRGQRENPRADHAGGISA